MAALSFKKSLTAAFIAYLAGALPAASAGRTPSGFRVERRAAAPVAARAVNPCDDVVCIGTHVCQPSPDLSSATCVPVPADGEGLCGSALCPHELRCCNPLRSLCLPPDQFCTQDGPGEVSNAKTVVPAVEVAEKTKSCGSSTCAGDEYCCNSSCGICAPRGGFCTQQICGAHQLSRTEEKTMPCGPATCVGEEECCNNSCGYCRLPGEGCTKELCPAQKLKRTEEKTTSCGPSTCVGEEECCNDSCGYCRLPGVGCTKEFCGF